MSFMMPKPPKQQQAQVAAPEPIPTRADPAIAEAKETERKARVSRGGRGALILTSGLGVTSQPNVSRPNLLGQTGAAA